MEIKAKGSFGDQDTIESVITFRVDGRTIKRGSQLDNSVI
jgi:hypothetical protein